MRSVNYILQISIAFIIFTIICKADVQESKTTFTETIPESVEFSSTSHVAQVADDLEHECNRNCDGDTTIKKCYYKFTVEWYITMSKACYDCPFNITDCLRPECVVADGVEKPIVTVNRRIPGPSIQVCEGDEIIVDVVNDLGSDSTTIHWHGIHQVGTPYMDGVPFLTQCPINGGNSFRYQFIADPAGTHYWHSHPGFQRADGMFGSIIARSRNDSQRHLYDVDDPEHVIIVTDWLDRLGIQKFVNHQYTKREDYENKAYNILINGLGKVGSLKEGNKTKTAYTPLYEVLVKPEQRYRFRTLSNGIQNCPIEISVDNHKLLVIASDGQDIQPLEVDSLVIFAGERWDFVVEANQNPGVYWMKFRGLLECDDRFFSVHQVAVFRYEGQEGFPNSPQDINYDFTKREGLQLNTPNAAPGDLTNFYTAAQIRSQNLIEDPSPYARKSDYTFWMEFVKRHIKLHLAQINNISFKVPDVPPLSQPNEVNRTQFCNQSSVTNCEETLCSCPHVLNVELGSLVEMILADTEVSNDANHPFHLHGHSFAVLGMERLGDNTTLEMIKNLENTRGLMRNLDNPPIKDSVTTPEGGYTVIRFIANNPGYWLFHCHLPFHVETGMALVIHVGDETNLPPVPLGFPRCGSWLPEPFDLHSGIKEYENGSV